MDRFEISKQVADILDLPRYKRTGKAWDIVNAVVKAMTLALQRGETVRIDGFGMFKVRTRKPYTHHHYYSPYLGKGQHGEVTLTQERTYVHFQPAKPLLRLLNDCQHPGD